MVHVTTKYLSNSLNGPNMRQNLTMHRRAASYDNCDQIGQFIGLWAIYCTLGKFLKPLATSNLRKSLTFLVNFCKGV